MAGATQATRPTIFQIGYAVLAEKSRLKPEYSLLVQECFERLRNGSQELYPSRWKPELFYIFLGPITLSIEVRDRGRSITVTGLLRSEWSISTENTKE